MALVCVSESLVLLTPTHRQAEIGERGGGGGGEGGGDGGEGAVW